MGGMQQRKFDAHVDAVAAVPDMRLAVTTLCDRTVVKPCRSNASKHARRALFSTDGVPRTFAVSD